MSKSPIISSVNNILIPEGLLRSVNDSVYAYTRRNEDLDDRETHDLSHIIRRPVQAVLASAPPRPWSRTSQIVAPARPHSVSAARALPNPSRSGHPRRVSRAASINVATLFRRNRQFGRTGSVGLLHESRTIHSDVDRPVSSLTNNVSPQDLLAGNNESIYPPRQTWSPELQPGRISCHNPDDIPQNLRQVSFTPHRESITVRRSVYLSHQPRSSSLWKDMRPRDIESAPQNARSYRQTSIRNTFEVAKSRQEALQRSTAFQVVFQYTMYLLILASVYFVLVGRPLWGGLVWYIYLLFEYHLTFVGGSAIFVGLAFFYAFGPLLIFFEDPAPLPSLEPDVTTEKPYFPPARFIRCFEEDVRTPTPSPKDLPNGRRTTALLIPCYKSADLLPTTLEAALKVFPPTSIYVLANGNSPTPLDDTEDVCTKFGVNHIWIPVGSKIVAQYVGAHVVRYLFPHVLLIDDDCLLPPSFPVVTERLRGSVKCLGYTLKSIGTNRSRGTWCQQAQDLEYKLSGLQRAFAGKIGSATFPHGAIVLWDTEFLVQTFKRHPGFSVSEDWFFGHVARILGSRITMCSSVFVETETPSSVFFAARGGARGGFGEMTVFKQRFKRWNFFFVNGCYYNLAYIFFSWRLGFREIGAKLFVFQEVYETFLYLITPIVLPISFFVRPQYSAYLFAGTLALYLLNSIIFNEIHLRRAGQMVSRRLLIFYYMPFKLALTCVNVASCWWSLWQYAKYFAKKHPRIVEDVGAVGVVLKIEEDLEAAESDRANDDEKFGSIVSEVLEIPSTLRRTGAIRNRSSGKEAAQRPDFRSTPSLTRMDSQRSNISKWSANEPGSTRPRRLTATAIKVGVIRGQKSTGHLSMHSNHQVESTRNLESPGLPSPRSQPVRVSTDGMSLGVNRATALSGGVFGQLHGWTPDWSSSGQADRVSPTGHRDADVMELVLEEEHEDEERELGGYSYYGL